MQILERRFHSPTTSESLTFIKKARRYHFLAFYHNDGKTEDYKLTRLRFDPPVCHIEMINVDECTKYT